MKTEVNGRTHEPSLRELTAELDGLRELVLSKVAALKEVLDERDRLYKERDDARRTAVDAALTAVKDQTKASFDASEKAIVKSDVNAEKWRENANEWRAAMMDRETKFAQRSETEGEFKSVRTELQGLRESRAEGGGVSHGGEAARAATRATIAAVISVVGLLAVLVFNLLKLKG